MTARQTVIEIVVSKLGRRNPEHMTIDEIATAIEEIITDFSRDVAGTAIDATDLQVELDRIFDGLGCRRRIRRLASDITKAWQKRQKVSHRATLL